MLVVDASAVTELLLNTPTGRRVAELVGETRITAPQLLSVEVASILQGWVQLRGLPAARARDALVDLEELRIEWADLPPLLLAAWDLRNEISCMDAVYVALARQRSCPLITCNPQLARAAPDVAITP